jgi:DNA (cytosine-5)-methyltransferase 1
LVGNNIVKYHEARYHNLRDVKIFKEWLSGDYNKRSNEDKISFYNKLMGKNSNHAKYRNLEWDKPSPTIVAHLYKDGLMFIHPDVNQARSITVKEAALLQSFPEDFEFFGSQGFQYKMIGNAVPPAMAKNIANAITKVIK